MQFTTILAAVPLFLVAISNAAPAPAPAEIEMRQSSYVPINTTELLLGACLAIGTCYYSGDQQGCYTHGCANETYLGGVCSCNYDVQNAIDVQVAKGTKLWPNKCPY